MTVKCQVTAINLADLSRLDLARLFGVTPKTVENWYKAKEDPLPYHMTGQIKCFVWAEALQWYVRANTPKQTVADFKPKTEIDEAKLQNINLKNEAEQIELDVRKGLLLEASDVKQQWSDGLVTIRQNLLNVGHTAAQEITKEMNYNSRKKVIDRLIFGNLDKVIEEAKKDL